MPIQSLQQVLSDDAIGSDLAAKMQWRGVTRGGLIEQIIVDEFSLEFDDEI